MSTTRRAFLGALAALPVVGRMFRREGEPSDDYPLCGYNGGVAEPELDPMDLTELRQFRAVCKGTKPAVEIVMQASADGVNWHDVGRMGTTLNAEGRLVGRYAGLEVRVEEGAPLGGRLHAFRPMSEPEIVAQLKRPWAT